MVMRIVELHSERTQVILIWWDVCDPTWPISTTFPEILCDLSRSQLCPMLRIQSNTSALFIYNSFSETLNNLRRRLLQSLIVWPYFELCPDQKWQHFTLHHHQGIW